MRTTIRENSERVHSPERIAISQPADAARPISLPDADKVSLKRRVTNNPIDYVRTLTVGHRLKTLRQAIITAVQQLDQIESDLLVNSSEGFGDQYNCTLRDEVNRYELLLITQALSQTNNNQARAAKLLGVKATTLNVKVKKYRIKLR